MFIATIALLLLITGCGPKNKDLEEVKPGENEVVEPGATEETPSNEETVDPEDKPSTGETPPSTADKPNKEETPQGGTSTNPTEPSKPKDPVKPTTPTKPSDKITYGPIEYVDTAIPFKNLEAKVDTSKDKGTFGWVTKGVNGISRKEVRKVYKNGKLSHTETVKNSYVFKQPVNQQEWIGGKVANVEKHRPDLVKQVMDYVNIERKANNLQPYSKASTRVINAANIRAEEIVKDYSHNGTKHGCAEALYKGSGLTPKNAVKGWIDSPGHYKILLSPTAKYFAVGVYEVNGYYYYTLLATGSDM